MKASGSAIKIVFAFAALAVLTLASSAVLGKKTYDILFLEALLFVIYLALHARESMKTAAVEWHGKAKEDVLLETPAAYFPGDEDDVVDKSRAGGRENGRLYLTKSFVLFKADDGQKTAIRREKIEFVRKGVVVEWGRRVPSGFAGVLLITAAGSTYKFYVGDIDRWIRMLKYPA